MSLKGWKYFAVLPAVVGTSIGAALLGGALLIQHHRHGWPFSLHHEMPAPEKKAVQPLPAVPPAPHSPGRTGEMAQSRAAVDWEPTHLAAMGIRTEPARLDNLSLALRAVATVVPDESRISHVHTRISGWIEALYVNTTGQAVRAGQPLAAIFSQELFSSQTEYLAALQAGTGPRSVVAQSARTRLKVLGMTEAEIARIERRGEVDRLVTVVAPHNGVVLHRGIAVGTSVDASTELMTVADLSRIWVLAEVPETAAAEIGVGTPALLTFATAGKSPIEARVDFIYPTLSERTRTVRARFAVPNPDGALRPGLFGTADFRSRPHEAVTVPRDAVVDAGSAQHVFVVPAPGRFEPRPVTLGLRLPDRLEIRTGLAAGEEVVVAGVFLLDSESRLRASGGGATHGGHGGPAPASPPERPAAADAPPPAQPHAGH
ncbi:MAG: efflux RND transporter periplasmic adaptor subunit [Pseudomonadota bacterium]